MQNHNRRMIIMVVFIIMISASLLAQDSRTTTQPISLQVAGSALLAVAGPEINLVLAGAAEAGDAIAESAENDLSRLRISSLVNDGETRAITAKMSDELVGTELFVDLQTPNANFTHSDQMGALLGQKKLSNETDVSLVEGIGTCWSGKNEGDGYVIKYIFRAIPNAPVLRSATITITYTISTVPSDSNN